MEDTDNFLFEKILSDQINFDIFFFLKKNQSEFGVREINKHLDLSSVGSTHWRLQKLVECGLIKKTQNNKYYLHEKYQNLRQIPLNIMIPHYLIGKKVIPNIFFIMLLFMQLSIAYILIFVFKLWTLGTILGILITLFVFFYFLRFYYQIKK
jgi:hypothetical protein